ncbi:MAG TPA: formate/nitrite transporter family protein [Steroidobacteraceae bacterium]|jgi:nitrite transporter NirC|nr:formate/nitrite transporter family protein [Steroidobacteraceae bacterium]
MIDRIHVERAAAAGFGKINLLQDDPLRYLLRSIGAGMGLTLVVFVFWVLKQNLQDISLGAVIASGFFGVGLMMIVFTNTELFTSNNMYLAVSSVEGRTSWRQAGLLWIFCYFGNLAGAILVALLLLGAGSLGQLPPDHALFAGALHKAQQTGSVIFFKGVLANWIVCLAVRIALRCKEEVAKILVLVLIVFIFVYLGFEHSIANMGTFAMAILGGGALSLGEALHNLLFSTIGNLIGGVVFVALPFTYLNPREREEQMPEVFLVREASPTSTVARNSAP